MSTINKIIYLLDSSGKTQKELTDYLGIEKSVFTTWKNGKSQSYNKYLSKIASFFNVSTDYLLRESICLDFSPHEYDNHLIKCPVCEDDYSQFIRIMDVEFYSKKSYGIALEFMCEPHKHRFYYIFESYKGNSYMAQLDEEDKDYFHYNSDGDDKRVVPFENSDDSNFLFDIKKYRALDGYGKKAVDDLLENEYARCAEVIDEPKVITLPMAELKASAGTGQWLGDDEYTTRVNVLDTPEARKSNVVIEIDGDSMEPIFHDGDMVLVKLQPSIDIGDIGIFIVDNCGFIKKLGFNELISINELYDNIPLHEFENVKCVGKVLGKAIVR